MNAPTIRMYRQGLGDAFLLSFPDGETGARHMLIDCGAVVGTPNATARIRAVAKDVQTVTGGRLDVLVITHEHWDHLSAFVDAADIWKQMTIGEVWLAWTEDEEDELARQLRRERELKLNAVRLALDATAGLRLTGARQNFIESVGRVVEFFGPRMAPAQGSVKTAAAMDAVKSRTDAQYRYLRPGDLLAGHFALPGFRVYVLGPPRDTKLLRRSNPSRRTPETYEFAGSADHGFFAAIGAVDRLGKPGADTQRFMPFEPFYQLTAKEAGEFRFFREHYGFAKQHRERYRRIEADWLAVAGEIALQLDNDTNNTSLALAIEHESTGRVLLFPADAQVGNWLSWNTLSWPGELNAPEVTAQSLLQRTVFYKVGHHCSHNATLREFGLERMTDPELVAFIPVDAGVAASKRWNMPFPSLFERLGECTRGRVLRSDDPRRPKNLRRVGQPKHLKDFAERVKVGPVLPDFPGGLYYDYAPPLESRPAAMRSSRKPGRRIRIRRR